MTVHLASKGYEVWAKRWRNTSGENDERGLKPATAIVMTLHCQGSRTLQGALVDAAIEYCVNKGKLHCTDKPSHRGRGNFPFNMQSSIIY